MSTTPSPTVPVVVDDGGVRIGTVDDRGQVQDFAGVHLGTVGTDDPHVAVDFSGVRLGRVATR